MAKKIWTHNNIVAAVEAFYKKYHAAPHTRDFKAAYGLPPQSTLRYTYGYLPTLRQLCATLPADALSWHRRECKDCGTNVTIKVDTYVEAAILCDKCLSNRVNAVKELRHAQTVN